MIHITKCPKCFEYSIEEECKSCGLKTESIRPPKFSPEDKYGVYRRKALRETLKGKGLL